MLAAGLLFELIPSNICFLMLYFVMLCGIWDLVPFVKFKKRGKHPWKSVTFSRVAELYQIAQNITFNYALSSGRN